MCMKEMTVSRMLYIVCCDNVDAACLQYMEQYLIGIPSDVKPGIPYPVYVC